MKAILISLCLLLAGCSVNQKITRKLRKADKLIKEAIALGAEIKPDTVFKEVVVQGPKTTVEVPVERIVNHDTTIYQDRVRIQFKTIRDTLRLTVECPSDTIRVPVTVTKSIVCPDPPKTWRTIGIVSLLLLILCIVLLARQR